MSYPLNKLFFLIEIPLLILERTKTDRNLKSTIINRKAVKKVAHALGELNQLVVFVGGAIVSLYIDDASADDVRPTQDIDFSMEIVNLGELEEIRETLKSKSFHQSFEDNVICRFRYDDVKVDVMAPKLSVGHLPIRGSLQVLNI